MWFAFLIEMTFDVKRDKTISAIREAVKSKRGGDVLRVSGSWGSFGRLLAGDLQQELDRQIVYICPHIEDADLAFDDLQTFGVTGLKHFAALDSVDEVIDPTEEIYSQRLSLVMSLAGGSGQSVVTSIQALCQPIPLPDYLKESSLVLSVGGDVSIEGAVQWLVDSGFERVEKVDVPGQFAVRGGIVDIFPTVTGEIEFGSEGDFDKSSDYPVRVEFFGDEVESIRLINLDTQRSEGNLLSVSVIGSKGSDDGGEKFCFLNLIDDGAIVFLEEPVDIADVANVYGQRVEKAERVFSFGEITESLNRFSRVEIGRFGGADDDFSVGVKSVSEYQHAKSSWSANKQGLAALVERAVDGVKVFLYCDTLAEISRVKEILKSEFSPVPGSFELVHGYVKQGFSLESSNVIVVSHHEVFGQFNLRRRYRAMRAAVAVDALSELESGDLVVHASYGIGRFVGIKSIEDNGNVSEYLTLQYADGVKVQVSVANIGLVQKYIGTSPRRPRLSKIGSKKWQKQKEKVAASVADLAAELLNVQANRQALGGIEFNADGQWQYEFEESFSYEETADQLVSIGDIKKDMQSAVAMDRLLCGDVGYGKTEIAMRAAFKAAESGKQTAILVPTTILSVQHGRTFGSRFADFPVRIEVLNRFRTGADVKRVVEEVSAGRVDIVIGTHRLLSKDVNFKDLGLLIIDEEQRFGVAAKEKLKTIRSNVDVLTMTATPIPRTLHMSLLGLRDISSLQTPPLDRRSVVTKVVAADNRLILKGMVNELNRGGQIFFLHNRVKTIEKRARDIKKLLAEKDINARIGIAHGRMPKSELESVMVEFVRGGIDILVCTTIIESGLDIPNANTIFIDNADRFGLAELHQLRGRVGRYKYRAYAYMLMPLNRSVTPVAAKRLKAIEEYSHLGAGFRIALRDLEIRGAGNILGSEQSGHIQLVGYQMYCELLTEAVKKLRGEPTEEALVCNVDLGFAAYIPRNYIASDRQRMELYRRIAVARGLDDLEQVRSEVGDVYGKEPAEVCALIDTAEIRIRAAKHNIGSIRVDGDDVIFVFNEKANQAVDLFACVKGTVRIGDERTVYLRLARNYFEPATLLRVLRKTLR